MDHDPRGYIDTREAAAYLGLSIQFLEIARHKGGGPAFVKLQRAVRYSYRDLDAFMAAHKRVHTSEAA